MGRSLTIIDADYKNWVKELSQRYRRSQIKAADNKYGSGFYKCLSNDLKEELPGVDGLSPSNLRCYVVIEVKMGEFDSGDIGQIGTYVTAVNRILCKDGIDNPTIGLLICKSKDSLLAQYALESSSQPIGISEFELSKLYPENVEGTIPTCEELEHQLMKDKE